MTLRVPSFFLDDSKAPPDVVHAFRRSLPSQHLGLGDDAVLALALSVGGIMPSARSIQHRDILKHLGIFSECHSHLTLIMLKYLFADVVQYIIRIQTFEYHNNPEAFQQVCLRSLSLALYAVAIPCFAEHSCHQYQQNENDATLSGPPCAPISFTT